MVGDGQLLPVTVRSHAEVERWVDLLEAGLLAHAEPGQTQVRVQWIAVVVDPLGQAAHVPTLRLQDEAPVAGPVDELAGVEQLQRGRHPKRVACVDGFVGPTLEAALLAQHQPSLQLALLRFGQSHVQSTHQAQSGDTAVGQACVALLVGVLT